MKKRHIQQAIKFMSSGNKWWLISLIVLSVFCLGGFWNGFEFMRIIKLDTKTAVSLAKDMAGILAAIFSITFVIIGFLINNISETLKSIFKLLFRFILTLPTPLASPLCRQFP